MTYKFSRSKQSFEDMDSWQIHTAVHFLSGLAGKHRDPLRNSNAQAIWLLWGLIGEK